LQKEHLSSSSVNVRETSSLQTQLAILQKKTPTFFRVFFVLFKDLNLLLL